MEIKQPANKEILLCVSTSIGTGDEQCIVGIQSGKNRSSECPELCWVWLQGVFLFVYFVLFFNRESESQASNAHNLG